MAGEKQPHSSEISDDFSRRKQQLLYAFKTNGFACIRNFQPVIEDGSIRGYVLSDQELEIITAETFNLDMALYAEVEKLDMVDMYAGDNPKKPAKLLAIDDRRSHKLFRQTFETVADYTSIREKWEPKGFKLFMGKVGERSIVTLIKMH